jgi:transposase
MLQTINAHAAAIDVGSEQLYVAVVNQPVQVFETFTESLHALRDMLVGAGVTSVAMEATGVYWLPVYEVLEAAGLEVCVVNGAHVKSLPGRKSDMQDCQWLAELHSHGLLRSGFVPPQAIRRLRDYQRLRQDHIRMGSAHIQHMQKALDRMNLKIHEVLSDLTGVSGLRLIGAILNGVRSRQLLLELCDVQILRRKRAAMLKALEGHWQPEHLFALRQAYEGWEFYQRQIAACDREIAMVLDQIAAATVPPPARGGRAESSQAAASPRPPDRRPAWGAAPDHGRARPRCAARADRLQRPATVGRGGHRHDSVADRQALHGVVGLGPKQPSEWETAAPREAFPQRRRPDLLCGGSQLGPQQAPGPGRLLPSCAGDARGPSG